MLFRSGLFVLDGTASLEFVAGPSGGTMKFLNPGGTLVVDTLGTFAATVTGFAAGDALDLTSIVSNATDRMAR